MRRSSPRQPVRPRRPMRFVHVPDSITSEGPFDGIGEVDLQSLERSVGSQPLVVLTNARTLLGQGEDPSILRLIGIALVELGRLGEARRTLERAVRAADDTGDHVVSVASRTSLAHVLLHEGDLPGAAELLERIVVTGDATAQVRALVNLSLVEHRRGDTNAARVVARRALRLAQRCGDVEAELRCMNNLGVFSLESGEVRAAARQFGQVELLAEDRGDRYTFLPARHNHGVAEMRAGNVPRGLRLMNEAIEEWRSIEAALPLARALLDHSDALVGASLLSEAADAVVESVALAGSAGATTELADGWIRAGDVAFLRGRYGEAREASARTAGVLEAQGRVADARHTRLVGVTAGLLAGYPIDAGEFDDLALDDGLELTRSTVDVRLAMAQSLRILGKEELARRVVSALLPLVRSTSPLMRISGHGASAITGLLDGNHVEAMRASEAGLRLIERHSVSLRSTALRLGMMRRIDDLAAVQIEIGVVRDRASSVLAAIEARGNASFVMGGGAGSLVSDNRDALAELRTVITQLASPDLGLARRVELEARERRIEHLVRVTSRGDDPHNVAKSRSSQPTARRSPRVPGRMAILFGDANGSCYRVADAVGLRLLRRVSDLEELRVALQQLRLVTRRLVSDADGRWSDAFTDLTARVGELLLSGVDITATQSVLIVPSASVADVPWTALPQLRGIPLSVSPSIRVASRETAWSGPPLSVVAVAGPDLVHAPDEARAVARIHGGRAHCGPAATSARTRRAFGTADLVHLAAHGALREDNPSMSSLRLADGPLTVYDLENLRRLAPLVVLSSCSVARPDTSASATVSSFIAALLAKGARTVVAATDRVDDAATAALMSELHGELSTGTPPAAALSRAQLRVTHPTALLFSCWGAAPIAS